MNDIRLDLLLDLVKQSPLGSIWRASDYTERNLDLYKLKSYGCNFEQDSGDILLELNEDNKQALSNFLKSLSFLPTQENHIYLNGEKIAESYDSFDAGLKVSNNFYSFDIKYLNNGILIENL